MKKKILSLALALALCLGLTVPAAAAPYEIKSEKCEYELSNKFIGMTGIKVQILNFETWEYEEEMVRFTVYVVPDNTTIISKTVPEGRLYYEVYMAEEGMWIGDFWTDEGKALVIKPTNPNIYVGDGPVVYHICSQDRSDLGGELLQCDNGVCVMAESAVKAMGLKEIPSPEKNTSEEAPANPFTDVAETSPFYDAILWAVEQEITKGKTATTFGPGDTCTVSHILTFLWRANGKPGAGDNERAAVAAWAQGLGIDTGDLSAPCTRAMAVTYMWKAAGSPEIDTEKVFSDVSAGAEYAPAVAWAVENGVTSGTTESTFSPDSTCTRGQIVTFLYRASK